MISTTTKTLGLVALAAFSIQAFAQDFEQLFTQKYKQEMLPELHLSLVDRYKAKGMSDVEINRALEKIADKSAHCHYSAFAAYDKKFRSIAHQTLIEGGSTEDATIELNDALNAAAETGDISKKQMKSQVKTAMNYYNSCVIKNGLVDK
mgnify:CR=1 FL=1